MARLDSIKRRVLREAVQENAGTRPRTTLPGPGQERRQRLPWRRRRLAGGIAFGLLLLASAAWTAMAWQYGLEPWTTLVTLATARWSAPPTAMPTAKTVAPATAPTSIDFQVFPLTIRKIAIDPGHGGEDGGAATSLGLLEKDITLDIARRLRRLLEQSAFEVLMTRQRDETVSLAQRAAQANAGSADLFISIHINWFKTPEARGPETYYLGPTDDPHTLQLAALENRPSGYSLGEYRQLLESVYLDVRRTQSSLLATTIQRELHRTQRAVAATLPSRGVKMAPFLVLVTTQMPAILIEVAYLSNTEEAQLLATAEYRQRMAQAMWQGIRAYAATLNRSAKKGS